EWGMFGKRQYSRTWVFCQKVRKAGRQENGAGLPFQGPNETDRKTNSTERDGFEQSPGVPPFDESRSGRSARRTRCAAVGRSRSEGDSGIGPAARSGIPEIFARGEEAHRFRTAERGRPESIGRRDAGADGARRGRNRAGSTRRRRVVRPAGRAAPHSKA